MSKSFRFKNNMFLDSTSITHKKEKLSDILYRFNKKYYGGQTLNANDLKTSGIFLLDTNNTISNRPPKVANNLEFLVVLETSSSYCTIQIWFNYTAALYFRLEFWGTWTEWKTINIS